jgi:hypothetical protein
MKNVNGIFNASCVFLDMLFVLKINTASPTVISSVAVTDFIERNVE